MNSASPEITLVAQIFNLRAHTSEFGFKHDLVPYILLLGTCPGAKLKTIYTSTGVHKQNCARAIKSMIATGLVRKNDKLQYFLTSKSQPCFDYFFPKLKSLSDNYRKELIKNLNKPIVAKRLVTTPEQREELKHEISDLTNKGYSQLKISRTLGLPKSTINHYAVHYIRNGSKLPNPYHPAKPQPTNQQPSFPTI